MKKGKWLRFGMGLCLLLSLLFLQGTKGSTCWTCDELQGTVGYLEIHNNTIYNLQVILCDRDNRRIGPYKITDNPSFLSLELTSGSCVVNVSVFPPLPGSEPVYYDSYLVTVPKNWKVEQITITVPTNYIPFPKTK
jgi:hypothetical protein